MDLRALGTDPPRLEQAGIKPGDIRSLDDFRHKVPFTDKDAIRAFRDQFGDPCGGLKCVDAPIMRSVGFTSGTTGDPTPLPFATSSSAPELKRDFWHIDMRPGDYFTLNVFTFREGHCADRYTDCDFRPILFQHMAGELA
jgi:phenylacetate-CoA ligase